MTNRNPLKIAVYHEKGGAGKSTLTVALASAEVLREGVAKCGFPLIGYFKRRVVCERSRLSAKPASGLNKQAKAEIEATVAALPSYLENAHER